MWFRKSQKVNKKTKYMLLSIKKNNFCQPWTQPFLFDFIIFSLCMAFKPNGYINIYNSKKKCFLCVSSLTNTIFEQVLLTSSFLWSTIQFIAKSLLRLKHFLALVCIFVHISHFFYMSMICARYARAQYFPFFSSNQ